jgi:hypothetical protein
MYCIPYSPTSFFVSEQYIIFQLFRFRHLLFYDQRDIKSGKGVKLYLITIGITIFMEGLHKHVPKACIYLPMGFASLVEMLQIRYEYKKKALHP